MTAKGRYDRLKSERASFLNIARAAADLTLPYLIRGEEDHMKGAHTLVTPWQSVGARGVVTLSAKLMLALLPPNTSFFKLQIDDTKLEAEGEIPPEVKSDLDLAFAKVERMIMEDIAASDDRVVIHQALKHLVVGGNSLIFMGPKGLKMYPLNRYVVNRDGDSNVIEIITKERVSKKLIKNFYPNYRASKPNDVSAGGGLNGGYSQGIDDDECDIYTRVTREGKNWVWYQEVDDKILKGSESKAPVEASPWIVLVMNHVDGENYGRGRVEEYIGDLKSLEALSQALVEGSAAAAKVVFTISPSSTTKPAALAKAGNGAIIQGRPDDIGVVQVGKTADFRTAYEMSMGLEKRLADAFLIMQVRNSDRTTAEEVRVTQQELNEQLGGLFSLLTVEFLVPYLNRKLAVGQKDKVIPKLPSKVVKPTIVAGVNALGRGQDREALTQFLTILNQTMGPEAMMQYINPEEVVKRLAASEGIDVLNLVKSMQEIQGEQQQAQQAQQQMELTKQAGSFAQTQEKENEFNATQAQAAAEQQQLAEAGAGEANQVNSANSVPSQGFSPGA